MIRPSIFQYVPRTGPADANYARVPELFAGDESHEAPVLLLVCGERDWPFAVAAEDRKGLAPPSYGSTFPAVQNILLACRALGLGATLTTLHQMFETELCERFGIGTRSPNERSHYPDVDLEARKVGGGFRFTHRDGEPYET